MAIRICIASVKVPDNIERIAHLDGEFPIKFLGSGDYNWVGHGRTFLYEEGDSKRVPGLSGSSAMNANFRVALQEADRLWKAWTEERSERERSYAAAVRGTKVSEQFHVILHN